MAGDYELSRPSVVTRVRQFLRSNLLTILTVVGVLGGTLIGILLRNSTGKWSEREVMYLQYPGDLFLRMLKCLIVPLLVASITSAIGALDLSMSGKIATRAIIYYMTTTLCAVALGIVLVVTVRPGVGATSNASGTGPASTRNVLTSDTLMDLVRNMFPPNIVQATVSQFRTILVPPENATGVPVSEYKITSELSNTTNVLGLVMFSVILGTCIGKMGPAGKPLQDVFVAMAEAMMIITGWVIWLSPIGVCFLVAAKILEIESFEEMVGQLGWYFMTVLIGLFVHGFGTIAVIFFLTTRSLPYKHIAAMGQVLATAFGTGSSSATMPITIGWLDHRGIDPRVTRFVIPVGATINMDGTALYEAVAAIFIAQMRMVPLTFGKIVAVCVTATAASIGAAGIPQAGLITMVMVLDTVGLPAEDVSIIFAVDWLLDRFRTTINVMCDTLGTIIVDNLSRKELQKLQTSTSDRDRVLAEPHELLELDKLEDGSK